MLLLSGLRDLFDLPLAEQRRGPDRSDTKWPRGNNVDANRLREAFRFLDAPLGRTPGGLPRQFGNRNDRAFAARDLDCAIAVELVQDAAPSSASGSAPRLSGFAGCSVEIACL